MEYVFKNNLFHDYDLFIGSKSHKDAEVKREISRELYSNFFNLILKFLFKISFKDTQGTFILKKASLEKIDKIISNEFFVSTEIVIRFNKSKMKILEIPLTDFGIQTVSTVSPLKDGFKMLIQAIKLKKIINKK